MLFTLFTSSVIRSFHIFTDFRSSVFDAGAGSDVGKRMICWKMMIDIAESAIGYKDRNGQMMVGLNTDSAWETWEDRHVGRVV